MDYSAVGAEEHHGSSPWASSPQHGRTSFGDASEGDVPSSPLPPSHQERGEIEEQSFDSPSGPAPSTENGEGNHQPKPREQDSPTPTPPQHPQQDREIPPTQPAQTNSQRYRGAPRRPPPAFKLGAKVTGLERTGRKDPILRFDVYVWHLSLSSFRRCLLNHLPHQTNLPKFRTTQFRDVRRTHSEFVKLAEHLISANPEALVPAVPEPVTSAGAGTDEDEQRVKANIQRWLNVVCSNDVLMRDEEMVFFVESDFGYSPVVRRKQPATGVRRKMIKQFAPPPDDTPELAEARPIVKMFYLESMGAGQRVDKVVKARRGKCSFNICKAWE